MGLIITIEHFNNCTYMKLTYLSVKIHKLLGILVSCLIVFDNREN